MRTHNNTAAKIRARKADEACATAEQFAAKAQTGTLAARLEARRKEIGFALAAIEQAISAGLVEGGENWGDLGTLADVAGDLLNVAQKLTVRGEYADVVSCRQPVRGGR